MVGQDLSRGPAQLVLTAAVARRYYIDGKSKIDIGDELGLSRFKVARLLEYARSSGLVRIEIGRPGEIDVDLSARLKDAYHLHYAVVVDTAEQDDVLLREHVGRAAAELVTEIVTDADTLGLGWGRSLIAMRGFLTHLAPCSIVQLTGALTRPDVDDSAIELVRDVARVAGGPAYYFYAPMIVPDAATAATLRRQPEVARAIAQFSSVTKAVAAIGGWEPARSTLHDALSSSERAELRSLGVHADVSGVLLDAGGKAVRSCLTDRFIGVHAEELCRIPDVIALAYGAEKASAARAAIRGGYVNGLVTHASFARALLQEAT